MAAVMSKIYEQINTYLPVLGNKKQKTHYHKVFQRVWQFMLDSLYKHPKRLYQNKK